MSALLTNDEIYGELRELARSFMSGERRDHTLSATDLFHEAYTRLYPYLGINNSPFDETNVNAVRALFATTMRRVLIDHARKRISRNRRLMRNSIPCSTLDQLGGISDPDDQAERLVELDAALERFGIQYPIHAQIVEMRFFGGLSFEECAVELEVCLMTVHRYWKFARAWLARDIIRQQS
jgi:RNA polymerase sigma-70 factor (ECF subfamily)